MAVDMGVKLLSEYLSIFFLACDCWSVMLLEVKEWNILCESKSL